MERAKSITIAMVLIISIALSGGFFIGKFAVAEAGSEFEGETLSSFCTDYSSSSASRKHNVELAVKSLDGVVVAPEAEFSFNAIVGERTVQNGYKTAKIIVKGKFEDGVGGGVCQVSTTLYNAVLRAGLSVTEAHPHSLPVSYVEPSFDAMVSTYSDLKFTNNTPYPLTIKCEADGKRIRFTLYGFPIVTDGETRKFRSVKIKDVVSNEYEDVFDEEGILGEEEERILKEPKPGMVSESYVDVYYRGELIETRRIRRDYYAPQPGIRVRVKPEK